ncbi:MAG: protein kinase [Thermoanaerobaculia bacterium]
MIGSQVGHYRILGKLGEGGMGVVYLAEDERLHRKVALKMLPPGFADDPLRLARFEREVKTVAALNHPSIITIYSVEEVDGLRFFTMEYLDGKTLSQLIPTGGMPLPDFLRIAVPLTEALAAAHAKGVQHRDLKPSNVMVSSEGRVKVLDFGLAKLKEHERTEAFDFKPETTLTQAGLAIGTLAYMAPEQLRMNPTDQRSDIFSLGVVLYEMASGRAPFLGQSTAEVISSILRDQPDRLYEQEADVPQVLNGILRKCLEKEPDRRWQSAAELRDAIADVATEVTVRSTSPTRRLSPGSRGASGFRRRATLVAAAAVALLVAGGWLLVRHRPGGSALASRAAVEAVPSLAVLPFLSISGEPEYIVDGMTDGLIGSLARFESVRVISRQSAMHYKGSKLRLPEIARELGVAFLVEGSFARDGDRLRVQARVVRADPEQQVWSEQFERTASDVFALQNEVATGVARAVSGRLLPVEERRMAQTRKIDPQVYQDYLQGRFFVDQGNPESIDKARLAFERAIAKDPTFAPAHAGLADVYGWQAYLFEEPFAYAAKMEASARRAIELDPELPYPYAFVGDVLRYYKWDWNGAETAYRHGIELGPGEPMLHRHLWGLLSNLRRFPEAREQIVAAIRLDPLSAAAVSDLAYVELFEGARRKPSVSSAGLWRSIPRRLHWAHSGSG